MNIKKVRKMIMKILWGFTGANLIIAGINLFSTVSMKYENWAYKLYDFRKPPIYMLYALIYVVWISGVIWFT